MAATLTDDAVRAFGATELDRVLGRDFSGRVFLAGGAFKTLLHGRPPRDLDVWGATPADRALLVARLAQRGRARGRHAFGDVFEVDGQEIEVPDKAEPAVLEDRLGRFDLALSAIGVEWSARELRCVVHPLARDSVRRREVLLLKPLVNWRHCLSTLARLRRYAEELDSSVPPSEEAAVWEVFDQQDAAMQLAMIGRYELAAMQGWGVLEDARARLRQP